ncbi:MAG TPA: MoxR family ATPase [Treponemataceae bacterium]|nr:MoxR family ATPase [Treponemataceae bacterium]
MKEKTIDITKVHKTATEIAKSAKSIFKGNPDVVDFLLTALFAKGHVLLEDVPGTGKTVLAKTLAKSVDVPFSRIQCTPDILPADMTGSSVFSQKTQEFEFHPGPLITSFVLVDELNRATPRTQSALLEAMAESQVSVDGTTIKLTPPFFVIATENPVESEGTFPLPEAQKDRFMMTVSLGYPSLEDEISIIEAQRSPIHPVESVTAVTDAQTICNIQNELVHIHVDQAVLNYLLTIVAETRKDNRIEVGVSPRGSIALYKAAQSYAAIKNRSYVIPSDIKKLVLPVYRNRIIIKPESFLHGYMADTILQDIIDKIPVPAYEGKL